MGRASREPEKQLPHPLRRLRRDRYYLASDTYIALFSRFLACGACDGHAILDFVAENRSLLQPTTVHSDTHGQSSAIFGLALLLGIELMPRIRSWQDPHLFRPGAGADFEQIDGLFTATMGWALIEAHLPDMLRFALPIRAGRLLPSAILRRLATHSRKNRLYFGFRELGRAVRTDFLLRYLSSIELRRVIQTATNKSELFNKYARSMPNGSRSAAPAWPPQPSATSNARWSSATTLPPTCSFSTPPSA